MSSLPPADPRVDTSEKTTSAYLKINQSRLKSINPLLGKTDTTDNTPNNKVRVKVYTPFDDKTHTYFHSMSIDKDVADFMGTAELRCPYDSDLMAYWEPARAYCVIYGTNRGDYKVLFIGRVREVNQQGYEIVIALQDYGWKFKQLITQSYANDNVIGKDGYTIMKLMFQALKIDSWVVTPTAKYRLKQVGIDEDGNVTLNKKEIEQMPDLLNRLKKTDPRHAINKYTVYNKMKESELHNLNNINYTLRYEKPTKIMKKTAKESNYSKGASMYGTNYGSSGGSSSGGGGSGGSSSKSKSSKTMTASGTRRPPANLCSNIKSESVRAAMKVIWSYQRGYTNSLSSASSVIYEYARNYPSVYWAQLAPCLSTLSKWVSRSNKHNGAASVKANADNAARKGQTNPLGRRSTRRSAGNQRHPTSKSNKGWSFNIFGIRFG